MWIDEPNLHYGVSLVIVIFLLLDVLWVFYKRLNIKKSQEKITTLRNDKVILLSSLSEVAASNFSSDKNEYTEGLFYFDSRHKYGFKKKSITGFIIARILFLFAVLFSVVMYRDLSEIYFIHFFIAFPVSLIVWGIFLSIKISALDSLKKN